MRLKSKSSITTELRMPIHPGEILQEEFLAPMGLSLSELARGILVPVNRLSQIARGRRAITPDTGLRLSRYFGLSPEYWVRLQMRYDFELTRRRDGERIEREVKPREAA